MDRLKFLTPRERKLSPATRSRIHMERKTWVIVAAGVAFWVGLILLFVLADAPA